MANEFKFQPSQVAQAVNKKLFIKRLPEWMQNLEQIQTFSDDIIQQWFNPAEQEIVDGYIGDRSSPAASGKIFINELTQQRQDYQLSPAYVSKNEDTSVRSLQFYEDLVGYMQHYGCITENQSRLFDGKFYSWTPPINPNKIMNFSSYIWDTQNEYGITTPDYVVMERGAANGNTWSLQNFWYTLGQTLPDGSVLTEEMMQDTRYSRALAPIIEYNKDIELLNYGTYFRGVVNYLSDSVKPEDIVQKSTSETIRIDGFVIKAGDRILFTSIGNNGENNRIYKVYIKQMDDGRRVYGLALDEDEESEDRPTGEPHAGDVVLVKSGNVYGNTSMYWDGSAWVRSQAKNGINTFPLFQLYDRNGVKLNNSTIYSESTFIGSSLFGLKINYDYNLDKVYNAHVELSDYNYYVFENFLQSTRYTYNNVGVTTEIPGFYYYNVQNSAGEMNLKTDWVRSEEFSKQYVQQVPTITKTAMFRVFDTFMSMEQFQEPLENMYAYVMSTDTTYQYYKASNSTFMDWHEISTSAVQSDAYTHTFELAQKINPTNPEDILEVYVGGEKTKSYSTSLNMSGFVDSITIDSTLNINEDTVIEIRTYSASITPDTNLGSYEIPTNLKNNPYNSSIDYVNQSLYTLHFQEIISKNITTGSVNDFNDYEVQLASGNVDNSVGTEIIQNEASMLALMINTANEEIDLFESIIFMQNEYFRFINKFNTQMINLYSSNPSSFTANTASNIVDQILSTINLGKDANFPFYLDSVGTNTTTSRTFIPPTAQFVGILKAFAPQKATYMFAGRDIGCYNISHTGAITKAYKVITGIDLMDDVIYELENRIFNSIDNTFKSVDYVPPMDEADLFPTPYYNNTPYTADEHKELLLRGYINFTATNGISNSTHDYDSNNWMTWNYTGTTYVVNGNPTDIPARGSWRAIYTDMFGTYRPATHPWEMFGFAQRPSWWNQEYKPTKVRLGYDSTNYMYVYEAYVTDELGDLVPSGLWDTTSGAGDASTGTILYGTRAGQYDKYKRFGTQPFTITATGNFTNDGEEIKVIELIAPEVLGLVSGALSHRAEPWSYGDMGDIEFTYMNTPMFNYDQALVLYRAKPAQFANYFYDTKNSTLKDVTTDGVQFQYGDTNKRLNLNSSTFVHGENNNRILGYQMFISNYLTYQSKNITTKYGDILRSSYINIGHKLGAFTKEDQLTFTSESFGLISQENQHIGLVKSAAFRNETLSAVDITWNGTSYTISGYDLVGATFNTLVPLRNSKKITVTEGKRTVSQSLQYSTDVKSYEYGTSFNTFQDVYSFLCAYGEYLEASGWIFEDQDDEGNIFNWVAMAKDFLTWSQTSLSVGSFISLSPSSKSAKFGSEFGSVQSVTQFSGGVWSLLDDQNIGIRPYEIETTRIGNVFTVRSTEESNKRIALIRLSLVSYEHAIVFDDTTIFNDSIYIPTFGSVQELIRIYGYVTGSWNGRLEAPGFIILENGTLPDFEKLVEDFTQYYDTENPVSEVQLRDLSRHLIGYQTRDYLQQMISSEPNRVDFYKGFIRDKGTNNVLERVLRVSKAYNTESYQALQEWAFKIGEYGNIYGKKNLQFQLINNEFQQQPQLITFDQSATADSDSNNIIYYGKTGVDSRWIARPHGNFSFPMRSGRSDNIHLPDIGPVTLDEVSYTTRDINTAYIDRRTFINDNNQMPDSVWMFNDTDGNWNVFDIVNTGITLESITPIETESQYQTNTHSILTMSQDVDMNSGDIYFFFDESNYMPDALKYETQYYTTNYDADEIVFPLGNNLEFTFTDTKPVLYRYVSRFATIEEREEYVAKKYSYNAPQSTLFDRPSTYNSETNESELYINLFDPINGVLPGAATQDISFISPVDPAMYNSNGETLQAWGSDKIGQVWWNTAEAYMMDYTRPIFDADGNVDKEKTLEFKRYYWGKLLPRGVIDVLEWVCSPVLPYNWDKYCTEQAKLNKNNTSSYIPSGTAIEDSYSEFVEYDSSSNSYVTKYYFWVRNTIYVPPYNNRTRPCNEIARIIEDPTVLSTPWFAPIDENSFILSNMQYDVNDDKSILTVSYKESQDEIVKHEQYQLCQEGDHYNFNPVIWDSLWDSLKSYGTLANGTVIELSYPSTELGLGSNKTWFENVIEARRTLVDTANTIFKGINVTTNTVVMDEVFNVKTTEVNPNEVSFKVLTYNNELVISPSDNKFVENDAVLVSTTGTLPSPLNSTNVYFVHFDENNYIRLMNSPSTSGSSVTIALENKGEGQHSMIKQSDYIESLATSLDMTQYWSLSDWYSTGYDEFSEYTQETSIQEANTKNYQEGDLIRITDSDGVWTLYVKTLSRDVVVWEAVGRQNSTVKLNKTWYDGYTQYNQDGSQTNQEINVRKALALLQNAFNGYQSDVVFDMVKYVHTEQQIVDWVFKTSYIYIVGLDQSLEQNYSNNDDLIEQIVQYFEEVKPYRTKIRSQIEKKTSDQDEVNGIMNDLDPNGYIFKDGSWIKSQNDIWDYEYAQYNNNTNKWEVVGSLPTGFELPNRRFQEIDTVLVYDNVQCVPDSDLYSELELEKVNNKYQSQVNDHLTAGNHYKLQRFEYTFPTGMTSSIESLIALQIQLIYSTFDVSNGLANGINDLYEQYKDDLTTTNEITSNIDAIVKEIYSTNPDLYDIKAYTQYNTLSNRLKIYTSMNTESIEEAVDCPFKGTVLSDNPNTRLPFGYGASTEYNYGYVSSSVYLFDKMVNMVKENNPTFNTTEVYEYLQYEYGMYPWKYDYTTNGKFFTDAVLVLSTLRNIANPNSTDEYEIARAMLSNMDYDSQCIIMIPRKYMYMRDASNNSSNFVSVPMETGLEDYIEEVYNNTNVMLSLAQPSINDLALDINNPLLSDFKNVITGINDAQYFNDMNAFDNLALESQTNNVNFYAEGIANSTQDSVFVDISDINPSKMDASQIRFTVQGYNFDTEVSEQLKNQGRFNVEGFAVINPYNKFEALVSIPRYEQAISLMQRDLLTRTEIKYTHRVKNVISTAGVVELDAEHDLVVGDTVAVFTPDALDYEVSKVDGTWETILEVSNISSSNRPTLFTVQSVNGNEVTISGLTFTSTYDSTDITLFGRFQPTSISIVRVTSFNDSTFVDGSITKYTTDREYRIDILNYDVFYDVMFTGGSYNDGYTEDDYDYVYTTNEIVTNTDGSTSDNGYYLPVYGEGVLSELIRTKLTESVQMFVYEYDPSVINPVLGTNGWEYTLPLVDNVFISTNSTMTAIIIDSESEGTKVSIPVSTSSCNILDGVIDVGTFGELISVNNEIVVVRNENYMLRGYYGTPEMIYSTGTTYTQQCVNLGAESSIKVYISGDNPIPMSSYTNSLSISATDIETLLN